MQRHFGSRAFLMQAYKGTMHYRRSDGRAGLSGICARDARRLGRRFHKYLKLRAVTDIAKRRLALLTSETVFLASLRAPSGHLSVDPPYRVPRWIEYHTVALGVASKSVTDSCRLILERGVRWSRAFRHPILHTLAPSRKLARNDSRGSRSTLRLEVVQFDWQPQPNLHWPHGIYRGCTRWETRREETRGLFRPTRVAESLFCLSRARRPLALGSMHRSRSSSLRCGWHALALFRPTCRRNAGLFCCLYKFMIGSIGAIELVRATIVPVSIIFGLSWNFLNYCLKLDFLKQWSRNNEHV